ncbi:hypothetical protein N657DRAFT_644746 [Parathielavia appendiculata]|uniref:Secreted protein n=1 Tax=Parathielavia appendiculata TaxID=2587402 RepID=A0AAN6U1D2_9PEZI|nr:hypothetical protein N657DRAFT_644746 [Parathielavia appendiculata]
MSMSVSSPTRVLRSLLLFFVTQSSKQSIKIDKQANQMGCFGFDNHNLFSFLRGRDGTTLLVAKATPLLLDAATTRACPRHCHCQCRAC